MVEYGEVTSIFLRESVNKFPSTILAVYIKGSFARGDYVPFYSDLDFYIIVSDSSSKKEISTWLENLGKDIEKIHGVEIDFYVAKKAEATKPDKEAYITSKEGRLLWGEDILSKIGSIHIATLRKEARASVEWWLNFVLKHPATKPYEGWGASQAVLVIAREALLAKGLYISDKRKVVKKFNKVFCNFALKDVVSEAYNLRENWASSRNDEERLMLMVAHAVSFFKAFKEYINLHPL